MIPQASMNIAKLRQVSTWRRYRTQDFRMREKRQINHRLKLLVTAVTLPADNKTAEIGDL